MTREEAREALSVLKIYDAQWLREAVDMAIDALSNTNQHVQNVGCVDLISRQDAIAYFFRPYSNEELYSNIDIEKALNALPSAPDSRRRETNKEIAERIIDNTCKNRVFCELYPDACRKEDCDIYLVINTFLNTPDTDTPSRQRGEWVYDANGYDYGLPAWKCDKCGCINANIPPKIMTKDGKPNYAPVNPNSFSGSNFCPNCGARMYKGGEDE